MPIAFIFFIKYTILVKDSQHLYGYFSTAGSDYSRLPKEVFYMYNRYLITGSTGFLGRAIIEKLVRRNVRVDALVLRNDPYAALLPEEVHTVIGDVCEDDSLERFFADADNNTCVIHCAGIISVASRSGSKLYQVNIGGTCKVVRQCLEHHIGNVYRCQLCTCYTGKT